MNLSQETIRTVMGILTLLSVGVGVYAGMQSTLSKLEQSVEVMANRVIELDKYDILLQQGMESNKERIIRLETQMESNDKNYDRLILTMDSLGDKLEILGNKLSEMKVK